MQIKNKFEWYYATSIRELYETFQLAPPAVTLDDLRWLLVVRVVKLNWTLQPQPSFGAVLRARRREVSVGEDFMDDSDVTGSEWQRAGDGGQRIVGRTLCQTQLCQHVLTSRRRRRDTDEQIGLTVLHWTEGRLISASNAECFIDSRPGLYFVL